MSSVAGSNPGGTTSASFCRNCGKALSEEEKAIAGNVHCADCKPAAQPVYSSTQEHASPYVVPAGYQTNPPSPGLAFLLGLLPGVGACYNGQFVKGLVHVFVFGLLISIADSDFSHDVRPLMVLMTIAWVPYMAFEAYHTAAARAAGKPLDEFSSLIPLRGGNLALPVALIAFGVLFLLHNLDLLRLSQALRFWPVAMIALGVYMLMSRLKTGYRPVEHAQVAEETRQ
jgi:TM2 domain-containing membrane protein YozV